MDDDSFLFILPDIEKGLSRPEDRVEKRDRGIRDRNLLNIVRGLLLAEAAFQEIYIKYKKGRLRFSDIEIWVDDKGQSLLYALKEQCHILYRYKGKTPFQNKQWLLDLAIGSIFHEAMKLRENIYQMEVYRPKYHQYKLKAGQSAYEKNYRRQFERIIQKARQGAAEGMKESRLLFKDAIAQLIDLFKESPKNTFLVRFLLESQPLLRKVYGTRQADEIFNLMFKNGLLDAYRVAGQSYLQSEHYDLASHFFSQALKIAPDAPDLQFLLNFSSGMNEYYRNDYSKSLGYLTNLIPLPLNWKLKMDFLTRVEEVCSKISSELSEEEGSEAVQEAQLLAERIRKCYDERRRNSQNADL